MTDDSANSPEPERSNSPPMDPPRPERAIARELRLRPEPPRVTRISRKVLVVAGAVGAVAVTGAAIYALQPQHKGGPADELISTDHRTAADGLATLPRDYTGLPRNVPPLGPPLPGDLGRPIVAAGMAGQAGSGPPGPMPPGSAAPGAPGTPPVDPAAQQRAQAQLRRAQEREAAHLSKLFAGTAVNEHSAAQSPASDANAPPPLSGQPASALVLPGQQGAEPNGQDRKLAFLNASADKRMVSPDRIEAPASPFVVQAGTTIAGALVTGIRSDLPGQITAQVTQNVYDSPTGRFLLVPQGAKLIGIYDSQVGPGQARVLLVWTRLILPDGRSIVLERQPDADAQGFSGLQDRVNDHFGSLLKAALLSTLLSVGAESGSTGQNTDLTQAIRRGASDSISQTGAQIVRRQLDIQPTLTVRPGYPVRVIVNRDLVLAPWVG